MRPLTSLVQVASTSRPWWRRYGFALLMTALALGLSVTFRSVFEPNPFLLFWLALSLSAAYGGIGPALLVSGVAVLSVNYYFMPPSGSFEVTLVDLLRLGIFVLVALLFSTLYGALRYAAASLHTSRNHLDAILSGVADGITVQDRSGRLIYANDPAARLAGFSSGDEMIHVRPNELLQRYEIFDAAGEPFPLDQLPGRLALQGKHAPATVMRFRIKPSGEERWSELKASPVLDANGNVEYAVNMMHDITDFQRAQAILYEQREQFRVTLSAIGDGVVATDVHGRITFINPIAAMLMRCKVEEAEGRPIGDVMHLINEATREPVANPVARVLSEGVVVGLANHTILVALDGTEIPIADSGAPIYDSSGAIVGTVLVFRDVTEQRRAETALQESEQRFRAMADASPVLIWVSDTSMRRTYVNRTWREFCGRALDQDLGEGWFEGVHPDDVKRCRDTYARALDAREPFTVEYRLRRSDGAYRWVIDKGVPCFEADEQFKGFVGSCLDITERRQAEEASLYLAAIVANSDDGIIGKTLDGTIVSWNAGAERIYGYTAEEMVGQSVALLHLPERRNEMFELLAKVQHEEHISRFETQRVRKDGAVIDISLTLSPIKDAAGRIVGVSAIERDTTLHKRTEAAEREQRVFAEALRNIATALNSTLDLSEVLDRILANIDQVVPHDTAEILLIESGKAWLVRSRGRLGGDDHAEERLRLYFSVNEVTNLREMSQTGQPFMISNVQTFPDWVNTTISVEEGWQSFVGVPIAIDGEVIGFINLISATPDFFNSGHADRLQAFAEQAAIAIRNARLHERARTLAAVEERQRLARELHDAVTQTLFSANVIAETLPRVWERNADKAQQLLVQLQQLTQGALAEMRTLLLELRPSTLLDADFGELLTQLARSIQSRKRIQVETSFEPDLDLPPAAKLVLYRIAQEALNNTVKHAHASQAAIRLYSHEGELHLLIADNGRGFDLDAVAATSLGLTIMRERAEAIGATLSVSSSPATGTRVLVACSLEHMEQVNRRVGAYLADTSTPDGALPEMGR